MLTRVFSIGFIGAFFVLAFIRPGDPGVGDTIWQSECLGVAFLAYLFSVWVYKRSNLLFAVSVFYFSLNSFCASFYRFNIFKDNDDLFRASIESISLKGIVLCILSVVVVLGFDYDFRKIRFWISGIALANILLVLIKYIPGLENLRAGIPSGLIDVAGINAAATAITLPALLYLANYNGPRLSTTFLAVFLVSFIVWLSGSSVAHGVLAVTITAVLFSLFGVSRFFIAASGLSVSLIFGAGIFFLRNNFLSDNSRFEAYRAFMGYWWKELPFLTGTGLSTFRALGPAIQLQTGFNIDMVKRVGTFFLYLHSDWLQILFETGVIGLALAVLIFLSSLWKLRNNPVEFSMLLAMGSFMIFYYPLHWFHSGLLAAYLVMLSQRRGFELGATQSCKDKQMLAATLRGQ